MDLSVNRKEHWLKVAPRGKEESEWEGEAAIWDPTENLPRCQPLSEEPTIKVHVPACSWSLVPREGL